MNRSLIHTHASTQAPLLPRSERASPRLRVNWATSEAEVREAQALRHQVFAVEMGARLTPCKGAPAGLDVDLFDAYCEHLLVRASSEHGEPGPVVGTYRVLTPAA
ncbi:MAG TPA: GNAT family N-acetyltransferase, partial [Roseateles sp.]|nr:GNAT family N-acetyltransferase [Roseateles sp.]